MADQDVYQLVDDSVWQGQHVLNVYFYESDNILGAPTADDLIDSFLGQVLPSINAIQPDDIVHVELRAQNLFNPSDRASRGISEAGGNASTDDLPIFTAFGFRLLQTNGALRHGAKRIAGVSEVVQTGGVITNGGLLADLDDLATLFTDTLLFGVLEQWLPVVVGRILSGDHYRLPTSLSEATVGAIYDALFDPLLTSQVSRKIGVGE